MTNVLYLFILGYQHFLSGFSLFCTATKRSFIFKREQHIEHRKEYGLGSSFLSLYYVYYYLWLYSLICFSPPGKATANRENVSPGAREFYGLFRLLTCLIGWTRLGNIVCLVPCRGICIYLFIWIRDRNTLYYQTTEDALRGRLALYEVVSSWLNSFSTQCFTS